MLFSSPLWLWLLLPWSGVAIWLMWGRRDRVGVPFIDLWRGEILQPHARRAFMPPPISIVLILFACLLAILAAARPAVRASWLPSDTRVIVIVERGITMSAAAGDQSTRFATLASAVWRDIAHELGHSSVSLRTVPLLPSIDTDTYDWYGLTAAMAPTAVNTRDDLMATIRQALSDMPGEPVIVLSDQTIAIKNDRVIQITPEPILENVGITHVAARSTPRPQVMIRVRNDSVATGARLDVSSDAHRASQQVALPPRESWRDYFVDLPESSGSIEIAIRDSVDSLVADDRAWLASKSIWPRVEARDALPPEVTRVIRAYQTSRQPSDGSPIVAVVSDAQALPAINPALVAATSGGLIGAGDVVAAVVDHPVTRHIEWNRAVRGARLTEAPADWTPIVSVEGRPVVAVREEGMRRVWMGIDSSELTRSPQYVIFWTDALDWLGMASSQEAIAYDSEIAAGAIGEEWQPRTALPSPAPRSGEWPGLYERASDGALRALNAPIVELPTAHTSDAASDWRGALQKWSRQTRRTRSTSLAPMLLGGATAMLALAAMKWGRLNRTTQASPLQRVRTNRENPQV